MGRDEMPVPRPAAYTSQSSARGRLSPKARGCASLEQIPKSSSRNGDRTLYEPLRLRAKARRIDAPSSLQRPAAQEFGGNRALVRPVLERIIGSEEQNEAPRPALRRLKPRRKGPGPEQGEQALKHQELRSSARNAAQLVLQPNCPARNARAAKVEANAATAVGQKQAFAIGAANQSRELPQLLHVECIRATTEWFGRGIEHEGMTIGSPNRPRVRNRETRILEGMKTPGGRFLLLLKRAVP